jgi:hypothetical protein
MIDERELRKMAEDPKFMAERWEQRAKASEKEMDKRRGSLTREERQTKDRMIEAQYERAKMYRKRAS